MDGTYHACEVRIANCIDPKGFHYNRLPLVRGLVYVRVATSAEWLLLDPHQFFSKSKRLRKNSRDTAQLL